MEGPALEDQGSYPDGGAGGLPPDRLRQRLRQRAHHRRGPAGAVCRGRGEARGSLHPGQAVELQSQARACAARPGSHAEGSATGLHRFLCYPLAAGGAEYRLVAGLL